MKVLQVIPSVAARYGGPSQAVIEMCLALQCQGVDVEICTTDADGEKRLAVALGEPVIYRGVRTWFFRRDWSEAFKFSRSLSRWIQQNAPNYDVVHIHAVFSHATYAAAKACRHHGVPYVVRPLGTLEPWSMHQKRPRKLVAWNLFFQRALANAAAVHYTAEQERLLTEQSLHLSKGVVVPNGVDETLLDLEANGRFRQNHGIPADAPFLLTLSRLHPKKGIDLLLKAIVELKSQDQLSEWRLVIAGDGDPGYVEHLRGIVRGTKLESMVHWVGWLDVAAKFEALTEADLFVLSSHQENFGIGAVEAMACGTPLLLSRQVAIASDVEAARAGWIVNLDLQGLSAGLLEATSVASELTARGTAARALVRKRFTWPKIAQKWTALYEQLAVGNGSYAAAQEPAASFR